MNTGILKIGKREIGRGKSAYIIAEMSANHAGSIERAKEIIRAAKEAGADCIKIQTYTPDTMTIDARGEYFDIKGGTWDGENLYGLYQKAYTPWEWQGELMECARSCGIDFFSTPFDKTSVDFLEELGVSFYKIASFELIDLPLIEYVASKGKPVIMSTGMGSLPEIEEAVESFRRCGNDQLALLRCASAYPAVSSDMNLRTMVDMGERFKVPVGLSDHSLGSIAAVTAVAMGGCIIEKHFCLSREIDNPDASFSLEPSELKALVDDIRTAERAMGIVSYGPTEDELGNLAFRRSVFATADIKKGELFTPDNIRVIRPSHGLHPRYYEKTLGRRASEDIDKGTPLRMELISEKD